MKPTGRWWQWQSDWAIGSCAKRDGILPTPAAKGLFNQFICVDGENKPFFCETYEDRQRHNGTEGLLRWDGLHHTCPSCKDDVDGPLTHPCTIHPIKHAEGFDYLWQRYNTSTWNPTNNVMRARVALNVAPILMDTTRITTAEAYLDSLPSRTTGRTE